MCYPKAWYEIRWVAQGAEDQPPYFRRKYYTMIIYNILRNKEKAEHREERTLPLWVKVKLRIWCYNTSFSDCSCSDAKSPRRFNNNSVTSDVAIESPLSLGILNSFNIDASCFYVISKDIDLSQRRHILHFYHPLQPSASCQPPTFPRNFI